MTPGSFDLDTCKEVVGDQRMRILERAARDRADAGLDANFEPIRESSTYWDAVTNEMELRIYAAAFQNRIARIARKKEQEGQV